LQFGRGNDELGEPTVQTDQNTLANVDGGNIQSLRVGEAGCQLPLKLLHVFGLARSTRHFTPQAMAVQNGQCTPRNSVWSLNDKSLTHHPYYFLMSISDMDRYRLDRILFLKDWHSLQ
jgi:hypothetical protein